MDLLIGTDVIQTENLENLNFVVIFELARNERAAKLRFADLGRVVALTTTLKTVLFHRTKFELSFFFTVTFL